MTDSTAAGAHEEQSAASVDLRAVLVHAADALHDAAWIMEGAKTEPPLPPPVTFVLPQTKRVEDEVRALISALDAEVERGGEDDLTVLGFCPHGVNLDREFCPEGCRV